MLFWVIHSTGEMMSAFDKYQFKPTGLGEQVSRLLTDAILVGTIKEGDKLTAVVLDGDKEINIAKEYTFDFDPVIVSIYAMSWNAGIKLTTGAFDNFELTGDKVPNLSASAVTLKGKLPVYWGEVKASGE